MATEEIGIRVHGIIDSLRIAPGDAIVVQSHRKLTAEQAEAIQAHIAKILPDNPVLILPPDLTIASTQVAE